jgi:hypothetical protein
MRERSQSSAQLSELSKKQLLSELSIETPLSELPEDVAIDLGGNASAQPLALLQNGATANLHSNSSLPTLPGVNDDALDDNSSASDLDDNSSRQLLSIQTSMTTAEATNHNSSAKLLSEATSVGFEAAAEAVSGEITELFNLQDQPKPSEPDQLQKATNETATAPDRDLANQSASLASGAEDLGLRNSGLPPSTSAGVVSAVRGLRIGSLLSVATAAKPHSSEAAAQLRPLHPLGSRTLRSHPPADAVQVRSLASSDGLSQALEGGDGRGSATSVLRIVVGIFVIALILLCAVVFFDRSAKPPPETTDANAQMRQWVRSLPVICGDEVKRTFQERVGYDCLHMQPQAAPCAVRLQGHIAALPHNVLKAPLARNNCVLFTTSATEVRTDGVRAPPTAFYAMSSDFDLVLDGIAPGGTEIRIRLRGRDAALFDVASGWRLERSVLANAPENLQDFLHVHRSPGTELPNENEVLDFTECLLAVGAHVTCVGELRRAPTGELGLWPLQNSEATPVVDNSFNVETVYNSPRGLLPGLTSWERAGSSAQQPCRSPRTGKVMISDDPRLLDNPASDIFSSLVRRTRCLSSVFQSAR